MILRAPDWFKKITSPSIRKLIAKLIVPILKWFPMIIFPWTSTKSSTIANMVGNATYSHDGFATTHYVGFLNDVKFNASFNSAFDNVPEKLRKEVFGHIEWRAHICCWAASRAIHLEGDFVELGVWYGILSKTICEYVSFETINKKFYLVDSFGVMDGSHHSSSYKDDIYNVVKERFK